QAKSAVKTLDQLVVAQDGDELIITASARSFLHHQVRTMVGTLVEVGRGRLEGAAIEGILTARDRSQAGPTAPPEGLCLMDVAYPPSLV
ncbi:MAG: tRNA pseudouridine(38-40) synthase TruA, partial [Pseudomonadota bacterium]